MKSKAVRRSRPQLPAGLLAGLACCAAVALAGPVSAGSPAGPTPQRVESVDASATLPVAAGDWRPPTPERNGVSSLEAGPRLRAAAVEALGDRLVEVWMAPSQDRLVVGVLDLARDEREQLEVELGQVARVQVVGREVARAETERASDRVIGLLEEGGVSWTTVARNYERGVVTIGVATAEAVAPAAELLERATDYPVVTGDAATRLADIDADTPLASRPRVAVIHRRAPQAPEGQGEPPVQGGKSYTTPKMMCTSAFVVKGAGGRYMLTAGHCAANGTPVSIGGQYMGVAANNTFFTPTGKWTADATVVHTGNLPSKPRTWVAPNNYRLTVAQEGPYQYKDATIPYAWVCFTGATTVKEMCGRIVSPSIDTMWGGLDHIEVEWLTSTGVRRGDSGGGLYGVNADASAIALGVLSLCDPDGAPGNQWQCIAGGRAYFSKINRALSETGTTLATTGRPPFGAFDAAMGRPGIVDVSGWAIDPDLSLTSTSIHVYVGGPAGSGAPGYAFLANHPRPDVGAAYPNTGNNHGFSIGFATPVKGTHVPIYVYAIDIGGTHVANPMLGGGPKYVHIW